MRRLVDGGVYIQARRQLNWNGGAWIASINCCQNCYQIKLRL